MKSYTITVNGVAYEVTPQLPRLPHPPAQAQTGSKPVQQARSSRSK